MKATSPFVVKVDSHITLKIRVKSDSIPLFNLVKNNKKHLIKWMPWIKTTKKLVDTEKFINNNLEKFKKGEACDMGVFYDGEMIGSAGYNKINTINMLIIDQFIGFLILIFTSKFSFDIPIILKAINSLVK